MRTSGKVLKDFESLRKALFNEEISHIAFMRDGKPEILYTQKYVDKLEQEIERLNQYIDFYKDLTERQNKDLERLNNIIKRLEEDLREMYITFGEFSEEYTEKRIKELKGDGSNE